MILLDPLREITESLRTHKARTALAVLTVAWGIFMLVLLLGAGRGFQNGVDLQFRDDAINRISIREGTTSVDYKGLPHGRRISYDNGDYQQIRTEVDHVDKLTARFYLDGGTLVSYGKLQASFSLRGVHPDHLHLEKTQITAAVSYTHLTLPTKA